MPDVDIAFSRIYCTTTLVLHVALILTCVYIQPTASEFGLCLISPYSLALLFISEIVKIWLSKKLSKHTAVFTLPFYGNVVRGDPSKGPYLRRIVLRFKKFVYWMKPYQNMGKRLIVFGLGWAIVVFFTVCFGAPIFNEHYQTLSFAMLVSLMSVLPIVQIFGPDMEMIHKILFSSNILESDPISHVLFQNGLGACIGAWFGAFPIPLDWDRNWQVWPITCCIGAVIGNFIFNILSLFQIHSEKRLRRYANYEKRKKTT